MRKKSIPSVSIGAVPNTYYLKMVKSKMPEWGARFDAMRREATPKVRMKAVAEAMGRKPAGVRHWINGTKQISLQQFLDLCAAAKFDPVRVLFGAGYITEEIRERISGLSKAVLEAKPSPYIPKAKKRVKV